LRSRAQEWVDTGELITWKSDFLPAIRFVNDSSSQVRRVPEWFVLKYDHKGEVLLRRVLDQVGMEHHVFTFLQKQKRKPPVIKPWLPGGYMFLCFDLMCDRWQQVLDMPHVIELLGSPVPKPLPPRGDGLLPRPGSMDDLRLRLPSRLGKSTAYADVAVGKRVRVLAGLGANHIGVVTWSNLKRVKVIIMMFNRPIEAELSSADVKILD
jgi:transcription antitermination factor NusG